MTDPSLQTFIIACPHCRGEVQATSEHVGYEAQCPFCESTFIVQAPRGDATRTATASQGETSEISQHETMSMPPSGPDHDDDDEVVSHIPPVEPPASPATPPPRPSSDSPVAVFAHALEHNYTGYLEDVSELNTSTAWQYAIVAEIIDAAIMDPVQVVRDTVPAQNPSGGWMFSAKKTNAVIAERVAQYMEILGRTQSLLDQNLPDPPWGYGAGFYEELYDTIQGQAHDMGRLHAKVCEEPLGVKEPYDELQRLMLCWTVDYLKNLHVLAERFREKAELPYQYTSVGRIQFSLISPSLSRFLDLYATVK